MATMSYARVAFVFFEYSDTFGDYCIGHWWRRHMFPDCACVDAQIETNCRLVEL